MKQAVILIGNDYQDLEVWYPLLRLKEEGWNVITAATDAKRDYKGKHGYPITADTSVEELKADDLDCVIVPGGWAPDFIRRNPEANRLVADMDEKGKVVAAICHGGWVLASAEILKGRKVTSFFAIRDDMVNAGAMWEDQDVVVDRNLITARKPDDLPAFCKAIINAFDN